MNSKNTINTIHNQIKFLTFQKVIPKENYHDLRVHNFYIYCYLNPFKTAALHFKIMGKDYTFGYEPIYIGKASTKHGYRHNQHIAEFLAGKDTDEPVNSSNEIKKKVFEEIEWMMKENTNPNLPSNWDEYQKNWVIILTHFDSAEKLIFAEKEFIKTIGVKYKETGPLTNAILG